MHPQTPSSRSLAGSSRRTSYTLRPPLVALLGVALATAALAAPTDTAGSSAKDKPKARVEAKPATKPAAKTQPPAKKSMKVATLERLPQPDYLSEEARQALRRRMERHGEAMVQLLLSMTLLQHEVAQGAAERIASEPPFQRPQPGGEDELGALPERFFTLQLQLRNRAKDLVAAAKAKDDAKLAASFGQLAETCVQCHSAYLRPQGP
jgi:hypothetical protein